MQLVQQHITELLQDCKKGSSTAQFKVYELYYKAMYNTAFRIMQNSDDAEDVMQEAFLNAFAKLDTFKGEVAFGAWLKRIVINKSLTELKKRKKLQEVKLEVVNKSLKQEEEAFPESEMDYDKIRVVEVTEAMNKLKDNYRMILNLSLIEGYDNDEIASIMNITNQNCRTTISRAKSRLRKILMETSVIN